MSQSPDPIQKLREQADNAALSTAERARIEEMIDTLAPASMKWHVAIALVLNSDFVSATPAGDNAFIVIIDSSCEIVTVPSNIDDLLAGASRTSCSCPWPDCQHIVATLMKAPHLQLV